MGGRDPLPTLNAEDLLAQVWREYLCPPRTTTVTEWAELHRILSSKDSAEPGPYRVDRTPYAEEPMNCLAQNSPVEEVVLKWGAQTSKTTIGSNWLAYLIDVNPGPIMIVQPTIDMAKRYSRQRLAPMIEESPALRRKVSENRSRDEANTTLLKEFAGGFLAVAGANSAAGLRSMPVRDLFTDEEDGYPLDVDGEGDPVQLAKARQTTFSRRKHLRTSTPTTKGVSRIETAYDETDRCQYHVPCPHCGSLQVLEWGAGTAYGLKWSSTPEGAPLPATVRYVCRHNGCEIREHHKPEMLRSVSRGGQARWVARNPGAHGGKKRGFELSSLYSPLGWLSWQDLVVEWRAAMESARNGDPGLLRVFVNTRLAETYEENGDRADEHTLRRRAADIPLRQVHWGLFVATIGVDVQGDRLEAYIYAWGRGLERQLVDRIVIYGDPSIPETEEASPWRTLTELRRAPLTHASGKVVPLMAVAIDSGGHHTQAVYVYVRSHQHAHVLAIKGSSQTGRAILGKPTEQDVTWRGQKLKRGVKLWPIGTDTAKEEIYGRLGLTEPGPGYVWLSKHLPPEVFEQITAERRVTRYVKGRPRLEWVKHASRRNEALDCAVYALAAAHYLGMERWKEHHWAEWQGRVESRDLFDMPTAGARDAVAPAAPNSATPDPAGQHAAGVAAKQAEQPHLTTSNPAARPATTPTRRSAAQNMRRAFGRSW